MPDPLPPDPVTGDRGRPGRRILRGALFALPVLAFAALIAPGAILGNLGMLDLRDALLSAPAAATAQYPPVGAIPPGSPRLARAIARLQTAARFNPRRQATWWGLGRAYLAIGQFDASAGALANLTSSSRQRALPFADTLVAFSYGGHSAEAAALALTQEATVRQSTRLAEAASCAYIASAESGRRTPVEAARAVLSVRPEDVWANWVDYRDRTARGDTQQADASRRSLATLAALPESSGLLKQSISVLPDLLRAGIWSLEKTHHVAAWLAWHCPDADAASQALTLLRDADPDNPLWALYLGALGRRTGSLAAAEAAYIEAARTSPDNADATLGLGLIAEALADSPGQHRQAHLAEASRRYGSLLRRQPRNLRVLARLIAICDAALPLGAVPADCADRESQPGSRPWLTRWRAALDASIPPVRIAAQVGDAWICDGFEVDEQALVRGEPTDLVVFWTGPRHAVPGSPATGWWPTSHGWVQVRRDVRSLLENGGFELGVALGRPRGFPIDIYVNAPATRQLVVAERAGQTTTMGMLNNSERDQLSSFASAYVPVSAGVVYLQAGWVKSSGGNGYFGPCFYRTVDAARYEAEDTYVQKDIRGDTWQHLSGATMAMANAQQMHVRLLNYHSTGQLFFDDTWLVAVDTPGSTLRNATRH